MGGEKTGQERMDLRGSLLLDPVAHARVPELGEAVQEKDEAAREVTAWKRRPLASTKRCCHGSDRGIFRMRPLQ
jgi:hypothetical protein